MQSPKTSLDQLMASESHGHRLRSLIGDCGLDVEAIDLFALLRHADAMNPGARLGYSQSPREDILRLGQHPSTIFAPSTVHSIEQTGPRDRLRVKILSFGLFGPNGALPLHLTEHVRERLRNHADKAPGDFVELFHHRLISLFYRAWADAQTVAQLDRRGVDKFSFYLGSLIGMGFDGGWDRDTVEDSAKLHGAGHLVRQSRNPEGLEKLVAHYFATACRMQEFVLSRMPIPINEQTRLGLRGVNNQLGAGAVAGSHLPDVQSRFRLILGEMTLAQFEDFLPPCPNNRKLRDWVRDYVGIEYEWDVQLLLRADEVPSTRLGGGTRLGWTTWLGERHSTRPAGELRLNPEADARRVHQ